MNSIVAEPPATGAPGTAVPRRAPGAWRSAWIVALRELTDHVTSARFLVIAVLVIGLTPLAVYVGARDYQTRLAEYDRLEAQRQELVDGVPGRAVRGTDSENERAMLRAVRPPEPLSVLVHGLDGSMPQYWEFTPLGTRVGPLAQSPQRLADVLGQLDLEFLVRVVLGLLAILLAFDAVAGEKELGTLRTVLSLPVSRPAFLAGKMLGGAITLLVPLILLALIALLTAALFGVDLIAADPLSKVALLIGGSALYLISFHSLGLLVSSIVSSQKTSLVILLVTWVAAVLAVPSISTLVAQAASPVPPPYVVESRSDALDKDLRRESELASGAVYREVTGLPEGWANTSVYEEHKEEIDSRVGPIVVQYLNERRRLLDEITRDVGRSMERQNRIARSVMLLSPGAVFAGAAADLAGTGDAARRAWLEAVQRQQGRLDDALFEDPPSVRIQNAGASFPARLRDPPAASDLPGFVAPRRDAGAAISRALNTLGLLLLYTAVFVAGAFVAFSRYDVR